MPALAKIVVVLAEIGLLLGALALLQRKRWVQPEVARKLLHVAMGMTVLSFPWLFAQDWPVLVLAGAATLMLLGLRVWPTLRESIGQVIDGVQRTSLGEIYYPIAVGVLWVLSDGRPLLFGVPILVLTLADALAALVGLRYGSVYYQTPDGRKSAEGSVAFFTVAMLSVHVPVLLAADIGRGESLLLAVIVGLLVMLLESIAWRGLDNLLVPLGTYAFLRLYLDAPIEELALRSGLAVTLVGFTLIWRRRSSMDDSALIAGSLFGYAALLLGGWVWLMPPLVVFLAHTLIWPRGRHARPEHSIGAVLSVTGAGFICLLLYVQQPADVWLWAYVAGFAAHLAIIAVSYLLWEPTSIGQRLARLTLAVVMGWLLIFLPVALVRTPAQPKGHVMAPVLLGTTILAAVGFERLMPWLYRPENSAYRVHGTSALLAAAASALTFAAITLWLEPISTG